MKFFKNLILSLLALVVVFVLVSCANDKSNYKANGGVGDDDLEYLSHIEKEDMNGYNFRILTRKNHIKRQLVEEDTGDVVNAAVYKRNEIVKNYFNINISAVEDDGDSGDDAINMILAGDDAFDAIFAHSRTAFNYVTQGTALNINDIETIDLTKEWWSKDIIDSCSVNGYLYVLDGDISTDGISMAATIFFNKRIFDELGLDYPYQLVVDGKWTFDEFSKLVKLGSKDLNGDGLLSESVDRYGFFANEWSSPMYVLYSGGQRIYSKDARGLPKLSLSSTKTVMIFSDFFNLANSNDVYLEKQGVNQATTNLFMDGRAMFADGVLNSAPGYRAMNDDFGILPFPKYSVNDEYNTLVNGSASLLVVPTTVPDANKTGKILEALCAAGSKNVVPAFYDISLKTKSSRDNESEEMIDIIKDTRVYDLGYLSGGIFQSIGRDLAYQTNPDFASYYAARESRAISDLNTFLSNYGKIG